MLPATAAFSDSALPPIGIVITSSQVLIVSALIPFPSFPITIATLELKFMSLTGRAILSGTEAYTLIPFFCKYFISLIKLSEV